MKKFYVLIVLCTAHTFLTAQNISFDLADPQPEIFEVYGGSLVAEDLDGDGDLDIVQSGLGENFTGQSARASVFLNDGAGNFTLTEQDFSNFFTTERIVADDLDGDADIDLIIASQNTTDIYLNDGNAVFTLSDSNPFSAYFSGQILLEDIDQDGDVDAIEFGTSDQSNLFVDIHFNDGSGEFTTASDINLVPQDLVNASFIDLEGDSDLDLIAFGRNENNELEVRVYENDGSGEFSELENHGLIPHETGEVSVGDLDDDGDEDVFIQGMNQEGEVLTFLYLNDGTGTFTPMEEAPFGNFFAGTNDLADLDNDGDLDVFIIGSMDGGVFAGIHGVVYENLGDNNYVAADTLGGEYIAEVSIADLNGDGKKDILTQGFVDDTNLWWNNTIVSNISESLENNFQIYPNPSKGTVNFNGLNLSEVSHIQLVNSLGQVVFEKDILNSERISLPLSSENGIYFLKIRVGEVFLEEELMIFR